MIITAKTIPHKDQRYDTAGDYTDSDNGDKRELFISDMGNSDFEFLVLIHELIEQHLCLKRGIPEPTIAAFDMQYKGDNPGMDIEAPYHKEHMFAEHIETIIAEELGVDAGEYNAAFERLDYGKERVS